MAASTGCNPKRLLPRALGLVAAASAIAFAAWYWSPLARDFRLGRMDLLRLSSLVQVNPEDSHAWYFLGMRLLKKGVTSEAENALVQAVSVAPEYLDAKLALGQLYFENGKTDLAFQVLKSAEASVPNSPRLRALLGRLYQRTGAYHRAESQWQQVLLVEPKSAEAWYFLAFCYLQMQQAQRAGEAADQAIRLEPRNTAYLRLRGSIEAATGGIARARDVFEGAIRLDPNDPRSQHDMANLLLTQGQSADDVSRAADAVRALERLDPAHPMLPWHQGRLAAKQLDWVTAAAEFRKVLDAHPALAEARFHLANACFRLGKRDEGKRQMSEYQRQAELNREIEETRIRIAIADDAGLQFRLGRLYRRTGDLAQAREAIENGLRLEPHSREGREMLKELKDASGGGRQ